MKPFDKLVRSLNKGEISRRDFLQKASALGLASAIPASLMSSNALAGGPKRGGHLELQLCRVHQQTN